MSGHDPFRDRRAPALMAGDDEMHARAGEDRVVGGGHDRGLDGHLGLRRSQSRYREMPAVQQLVQAGPGAGLPGDVSDRVPVQLAGGGHRVRHRRRLAVAVQEEDQGGARHDLTRLRRGGVRRGRPGRAGGPGGAFPQRDVPRLRRVLDVLSGERADAGMSPVEGRDRAVHLLEGDLLPGPEDAARPRRGGGTARAARGQGDSQRAGRNDAGRQARGPRPPRGTCPRAGHRNAPTDEGRRCDHFAHCPSV
jgi:hypothetical protein